MKAVYIEIAFAASVLSTIITIATESLTSYPGDLVSQDVLVIMGIVSACLSAATAMLLKRASS